MQSKYFGEEKDNFSCMLQKRFVFLASLRALLVFSLSTNCNCVNFFRVPIRPIESCLCSRKVKRACAN